MEHFYSTVYNTAYRRSNPNVFKELKLRFQNEIIVIWEIFLLF